jgi:hypothetical protein
MIRAGHVGTRNHGFRKESSKLLQSVGDAKIAGTTRVPKSSGGCPIQDLRVAGCAALVLSLP